MFGNFFEFEGKYYNLDKLISYSKLTTSYYKHIYEDCFYVYYHKELVFFENVKLCLKSEEFCVPKYIETGKIQKVKFLFFTFNKKEEIINPIYEIIENKSWVEAIEKETKNDNPDNIVISKWFAEKTNTEKMFEEIYYRCKILKERIDKTFKGVKE